MSINNNTSNAKVTCQPAAPPIEVASTQATCQAPITAVNQAEVEGLAELEHIEADDDSAYSSGGSSLGNTSISSSVLRGYYENGRRYQSLRDHKIDFPSDEKQWRAMDAAHMTFTILEAHQDNPYFRSPISSTAQHVLDLGTGTAVWANDVADRFPNLTVHGVDLYPPPTDWVAPNCVLEVDDFTKPWTWSHKFDLVHIRLLIGTMSRSEWGKLYRRAYDNLQPGGWFEHVEIDTNIHSNDAVKPLPEDSLLGKLGAMMLECGRKADTGPDVTGFMKEEIEAAGFTNVHEKKFQMPIGGWPKHPIYKDAGTLQMVNFKEALEGWLMWTLTKWGSPTPWSPSEVQILCAKLRSELNEGYHIFQYHRRVWAQKPFNTTLKTEV